MRLIPTLDSSDAISVRDTALGLARERGVSACIAVVDAAGVLLDLHRPDVARPHTVDLATRKARTSSLLGLDTLALETMVKSGRSLPAEVLALGGGAPIMHEGRCAGAVGVSGGASELDHEIAMAAAAAVRQGPLD